MDLGIDVTPFNIGSLNASVASAAAGSRVGGGRGNFIKLGNNTVTSFFVLPAWSRKGLLGKEVWECYDLPPKAGQKWSRHVAWTTHESLEPGIGAKDPVLRVLQELKAILGDKVQRMLPSKSYYVNVIIRGTSQLDKSGNVISGSWVENNPPIVGVIRLTPKAYGDLAKSVIALSTPPSTPPSHYGAAVPYQLVKGTTIRKDGSEQAAYLLTPEGRQTAQGIIPDRVNLVETYGEAFVKAAYTTDKSDLDALFPMPTEAQRVETEFWASEIRTKVTAKLRSDVGAAPQTRAPVTAPQAPATPPSQAPVEAPAAQPVQPPLPTPTDVKTKDLGLAAPPRRVDTGLPFCVSKFSIVSVSPNGRWCEQCSYRNPCKAKEAAGGK